MKPVRNIVFPPLEQRIWRGHKVPYEFDAFFVSFHQDFHVVFQSVDAAIDEYVGSLNPSQRVVVRAFLDSLLDGRYSNAELKGIWPDTDLIPAKPAAVFQAIQNKLSAEH